LAICIIGYVKNGIGPVNAFIIRQVLALFELARAGR
jgi:hypothetical protein